MAGSRFCQYTIGAMASKAAVTSAKGNDFFAEVTAAFDAIAPMVYWQNRDPATDVAGAIDYLAQFN
ncbi:MAG TPA: hypothetical protein VG795_02250, partial [Acidimicrobiia bacterium]|nr:hypothetical protein [Acidimicrobiia bacterium]